MLFARAPGQPEKAPATDATPRARVDRDMGRRRERSRLQSESASARWTSMAEQGRVDRARTGIRFGRRARAQLTLGDQRLSPGRLVGMEARGVLRGIAGVKRQGRHA